MEIGHHSDVCCHVTFVQPDGFLVASLALGCYVFRSIDFVCLFVSE